MAFYKEKIQKELKKTLQSYKTTHNKSMKLCQIKKEGKIKRLFRPKNSYKQEAVATFHAQEQHILNFYNILMINQKSLIDGKHHESYLQASFFSKTIRKIQIKQNYIVLFLKDSGLQLTSIEQVLARYQSDENYEVRQIGFMLDQLAQKMKFDGIDQDSDVSLTAQTYELLDSIGDIPFVCKILSQKLVISISLLKMLGYNPEEFVLECMKFKFPVFEILTCQNYPQIVKTQISFYQRLIEVLQNNLTLSQFLAGSSTSFIDKITSISNTEYQCQVSLSMPIPLVELLKVDKILNIQENKCQRYTDLVDEKFKKYKYNIWAKENKMLQYLTALPSNRLPKNKNIVADYQQIKEVSNNCKIEQDDKKSAKELSLQNSGTFDYPFNNYDFDQPYFYLTF